MSLVHIKVMKCLDKHPEMQVYKSGQSAWSWSLIIIILGRWTVGGSQGPTDQVRFDHLPLVFSTNYDGTTEIVIVPPSGFMHDCSCRNCYSTIYMWVYLYTQLRSCSQTHSVQNWSHGSDGVRSLVLSSWQRSPPPENPRRWEGRPQDSVPRRSHLETSYRSFRRSLDQAHWKRKKTDEALPKQKWSADNVE